MGDIKITRSSLPSHDSHVLRVCVRTQVHARYVEALLRQLFVLAVFGMISAFFLWSIPKLWTLSSVQSLRRDTIFICRAIVFLAMPSAIGFAGGLVSAHAGAVSFEYSALVCAALAVVVGATGHPRFMIPPAFRKLPD